MKIWKIYFNLMTPANTNIVDPSAGETVSKVESLGKERNRMLDELRKVNSW